MLVQHAMVLHGAVVDVRLHHVVRMESAFVKQTKQGSRPKHDVSSQIAIFQIDGEVVVNGEWDKLVADNWFSELNGCSGKITNRMLAKR